MPGIHIRIIRLYRRTMQLLEADEETQADNNEIPRSNEITIFICAFAWRVMIDAFEHCLVVPDANRAFLLFPPLLL